MNPRITIQAKDRDEIGRGRHFSWFYPEMSKPLKTLTRYGGLLAITLLFMFLDPAVRPLLQFLMVPLLSIVLWRISIQDVRIPRVLFALAFLGVGVGAIIRFSTVHLRDGAFVVATVSKQGLWQETKIYRDRLHRALGSDGRALAGLHRGTIESQSKAESVLADRRTLGGVVWGAPRWMSISFREIPGVSLGSFPERSFAKRWLDNNHLQDLRVIRSIPSVGLSHGHQDATVHFIADMIPLWNDFARHSTPNMTSPDLESRLAGLARTQARWSSRSHIGLVLWMLGTYHLVRAVENDSISGGDLACALREFAEALGQFRPRDNPSLYAALQNNFGIAMLIDADFSEKRDKGRTHALKRIKVARRIAVQGSDSSKDIGLNSMALGISQGRKSRDKR
jgi:hypothetical protein